MRIIDLKTGTEANRINRPLCLFLGNFDGVHTGHTALGERAKSEGRRNMLAVGAWSFEKHPMDYIGEAYVPKLTSVDEKCSLFAKMGIDYMICEDFTRVKDYSPEEFVSRVLVSELDCKIAVCGFNFRFGKNGLGDADRLKKLMENEGRTSITLPPVSVNGVTVSSSEIRFLLEEGRTDEANRLLGRPYSLTAEVVHGKSIGRELGFPTANQLFPREKVRLKNGIYAVICVIDGVEYDGVANVGCRPTVNEDENDVNCETHIIGYRGELYGKNLEVRFLKRLRGEMRFSSIDELKSQIEKDVEEARVFLASIRAR